jgi:thymidylate synthase
MLQEMMARRLGIELGEYYQYIGSMHVYIDYLEPMKEYLAEGHQKAVEMPGMPAGDPFLLVPQLLEAEKKIRHGEAVVVSDLISNEYWEDIVRLVQVFWATDHEGQFNKLKADFVSPMYRSYLEGRRHLKPRALEIRRDEC